MSLEFRKLCCKCQEPIEIGRKCQCIKCEKCSHEIHLKCYHEVKSPQQYVLMKKNGIPFNHTCSHCHDVPAHVGRGRGRVEDRVADIPDVAEEIPTVVGRGRGRRRAHVDALSDEKADTEIPTTVGRNLRRGRVGGRVDALAESDTEIPTAVGRGRGRRRAHVDALSTDVAEEIPTVVGRGRGRRRAHVDALSTNKADTEIPTTVGRGRGRVGGDDMREQRQETSDFHKELFSIWGSYSVRVIRTPTLLDKLFELYTNNNVYVTDADVDDERDDEE